MVTAKLSRWFIPLMLLALTLFCGCGSFGGVEKDDNIGIEIQAQDAGAVDDAGTLTIDVVQNCCKEDGEDGHEFNEPYGDTMGRVTFKYIGADGVDVSYRFDSYTVTYIPHSSPDGRGGTFVPPNLQPLDRRIANTVILSRNFTEAHSSIILMPTNTKREYRFASEARGLPINSHYSIEVTFFGEKNHSDFSIETARDLLLGGYNRCPEGTTNIICN